MLRIFVIGLVALFLTGCASLPPVHELTTDEGKKVFCVEKEQDGEILGICKDEPFSESELEIIASSNCFEWGDKERL